MNQVNIKPPKAIIGLGNPGSAYEYTRHNIGFRVVDELASMHSGDWRSKDIMEMAKITIANQPVILIKPQTFMNSSGKVIPFLAKQGIAAEDILVVHDELELPFGKIALKVGGSAKGHNGLKSIISACGESFGRLRFGIGRPEVREEVPNYVLQNFRETAQEVDNLIQKSLDLITSLYK